MVDRSHSKQGRVVFPSVKLFPIMTETPERQRNWMPWAGLLLALAALFSNAGFFVSMPGQKALALFSLALALAAMVCAAIGVMRAFRQPQIYGGKVSSSILGVISVLICVFATLTYVGARKLPAATEAPQIGQKVPDFTLADTNGKNISLAALLGNSGEPGQGSTTGANPAPKAVLLIFYRGYW